MAALPDGAPKDLPSGQPAAKTGREKGLANLRKGPAPDLLRDERGHLLPRAVPAESVEVQPNEAVGDEPGQLLDMRLVMSGPARAGETYRQRELREHYKANRRQFMAEAAKLEAELIAARGKQNSAGEVGEGPGKADVGSQENMAAVRKWLEERRAEPR